MPEGAKTARLADRSAIATVPNLISLGRLCAVPFIVGCVLRGHLDGAIVVFVLACLSDAADGWLARRRTPTRLGAILDPAADKLLLAAMYTALACVHLLPGWLAMLVVLRDALIVGGLALALRRGERVVIAPPMVSKLNTVVQMGGVAIILGLAAGGLQRPGLQDAVLACVAATTLASGAWYLAIAIRGHETARH